MQKDTYLPDGQIDRRALERFSLNAPAVVHIGGRKKASIQRSLHTHCQDISSNGAFFLTGDSVEVGTAVDAHLSFHLWPNRRYRKNHHQVNMQISGKVIRSEKAGFAVKFGKKYSLSPEKWIEARST